MANLLPQDVAALSPEEQLKKLLESSSVPTTPGGAPLGQGVGGGPAESISPYDPRATALAAPSVDAEGQEFGMPRMEAPNQTSGELLSSQADIHNNKAMSLLQKALESQSEVSPSQALAAGVLALVPTLGGYLAGKSVGTPELSPHLRLSLDQLQGGLTGGAQGGLTGLAGGAKAAQDYLGGIDKEFQQKQKIMGEQAGLEAKLGNQYKNADLQNQVGVLGANRQLQKELEVAKYKDQLETLPAGAQASALQSLGVDPGLELSPSQLRVLINAKEAGRRQEGQTFRQGQSELAGFRNVGNAVLTPQVISRLSAEREGVSETTQLLMRYIENPEALVGQESAINAALSGMLMNAQRRMTGSGANFTDTEQKMVRDALPAMAAGNLAEWTRRNALGRDQQQFARDLIGVYQKTSDFVLADTYGLLRNDVPLEYYPKKILAKWGQIPAEGAAGVTATGTNTQAVSSEDKLRQYEEEEYQKLKAGR